MLHFLLILWFFLYFLVVTEADQRSLVSYSPQVKPTFQSSKFPTLRVVWLEGEVRKCWRWVMSWVVWCDMLHNRVWILQTKRGNIRWRPLPSSSELYHPCPPKAATTTTQDSYSNPSLPGKNHACGSDPTSSLQWGQEARNPATTHGRRPVLVSH
jgi:hypothetical protein